MNYKSILHCGFAAICVAAPAFAQDVDTDDAGESKRLDTVTVTGLRPVDLADSTVAVTVLDSDELAIRNSPYVADQLRGAPGVAVSRSGALGGLTQVRMRGAEANHTLVLIDGVEVSDPATGETDMGLWSGLEANRVEVARGEQSALHGSDAIGGVIAVTTGGEGLRGAVEAGSYDTTRAFVAYDADLGPGRVGAALSGFRTAGVDTAGLDGEKDGARDWSGLVRGGAELGGDWSLKALARYGEARIETDPDLDYDGRLDNADRVTESRQLIVGAAADGTTGLVSHVVRASFGETERENMTDGAYVDRTTGTRSKLSWSPGVERDLGASHHAVLGLVDYEVEDYERRSTDTLFGDPNQSQSFTTAGAALEYRFDLGPFAANASVRHDDNDGRFDNATTWRVGAAYNVEAIGGRVRASIGQGVKNPTFTELFGYYPGSFVGNPDLVPEKSVSHEIGWDQELPDGQASLTWFSARLEDEIYTAFNPDWTSTAANRTGKSKREGIEFSAAWSPTDRLALSAMATKITSTDAFEADEIRVPDWTGSLAVSLVDDRGDRVSLAADYVGEQLDMDFGTFSTVSLDAYTLISVTVDVPVSERASFTLRAENLLGEQATDVFGYHAPGAGFHVGFRLR